MDRMDPPDCSDTCLSAWLPTCGHRCLSENRSDEMPGSSGQRAVRAGNALLCVQVKEEPKSVKGRAAVACHLSFSCGRGRFQSAGGFCLKAHTRVCF